MHCADCCCHCLDVSFLRWRTSLDRCQWRASSATRSRTIGNVFGSHTSLGASLPGRVHQWLGCGCLQGDGFCWLRAVSRNAQRAQGTTCFARPKNHWQCPAPGLGTRLVSLCEHEAHVGAAKTANRFMRCVVRGMFCALC